MGLGAREMQFIKDHKVGLAVGAVGGVAVGIGAIYFFRQETAAPARSKNLRCQVSSAPKKAEEGVISHSYEPVPEANRDATWKQLNFNSEEALVNGAFDAVDSNADGKMSRKELKYSGLGEYLSKVWTNMTLTETS